MAQDQRGQFVWHDLMTTDPQKAKAFYGAVIGWSTQPFEGSLIPYDMWTTSQGPLGGVMVLPEDARKAGSPPHWLAYVATADVDETVEQATGLGARTLVPGTDIPSVGRFGVVADPQGAVFAVYSAASPREQPEVKPGQFSWHELATSTDPETALGFYRALFGWEKRQAMDMGEALGTYQIYGAPGGPDLGGIYTKPKDMPFPPHWLHYIRVDNVPATLEKVKAGGGQVLNGPMEVPGGVIAQCLDPQGAAFALHHVNA
ncbi:MAG TPA: VOC family protein [Vicinamibacteria bacterium]|jgi:predicted enzyme related to lactoylglutathione lyase